MGVRELFIDLGFCEIGIGKAYMGSIPSHRLPANQRDDLPAAASERAIGIRHC